MMAGPGPPPERKTKGVFSFLIATKSMIGGVLCMQNSGSGPPAGPRCLAPTMRTIFRRRFILRAWRRRTRFGSSVSNVVDEWWLGSLLGPSLFFWHGVAFPAHPPRQTSGRGSSVGTGRSFFGGTVGWPWRPIAAPIEAPMPLAGRAGEPARIFS